MRFYSRRQVQAMVDRTYALALNDAASAAVNGWPRPWQTFIPKVKRLRRDLREAGTWPDANVAAGLASEASPRATSAFEEPEYVGTDLDPWKVDDFDAR